jgi:hypothetical protein
MVQRLQMGQNLLVEMPPIPKGNKIKTKAAVTD